jgi:hypothetical protein
MAKPDIDEVLQHHWQAITPFISVDADKVQVRQRSQKLRLWSEFFGSALSLAIALLFWWQGTSTLTDIAGAVMFVSGIGSGILAKRARKPLLNWQDWTPQGVLEYRLKETDTTLKLIRNAFCAAALLCLFTLYLWWGSRFTPETVSVGFARLYSSFSVPAILLTVWWAGRQWRKTLERQRNISTALLSFREMQ